MQVPEEEPYLPSGEVEGILPPVFCLIPGRNRYDEILHGVQGSGRNMNNAGSIIRREPPKFKLTEPGPFVAWIVERVAELADQNTESMKTVSDAITALLPLMEEQNDLLREMRDCMVWARQQTEKEGK